MRKRRALHYLMQHEHAGPPAACTAGAFPKPCVAFVGRALCDEEAAVGVLQPDMDSHEAQTQAHGHLPELLRQFKAAVLEVIDEKS